MRSCAAVLEKVPEDFGKFCADVREFKDTNFGFAAEMNTEITETTPDVTRALYRSIEHDKVIVAAQRLQMTAPILSLFDEGYGK